MISSLFFRIKIVIYLGKVKIHNTQRPHKSLGLKSSLEYMIEKGGMSQMYVTNTNQ